MSKAETLVQLAGVGKSFPLITHSADRLRALTNLLLGRPNPLQTAVLADIDLTVVRGESLGLIGVNGAGKSTLLKVITGVLTPTTGTVVVHGRIAPMLELGAGFHPEYSGRENIRLNAALLGMSTTDIEAKLESIIAFADIGRYIDEPVKHYSSGMTVRLGFAVVSATHPDLLITDEVLAVGDASFQKKCVKWMEAYLADGGTMLLVSHSMYHIQKLCRHACWIHEGRIRHSGDVFDVTQDYLAWHERQTATLEASSRESAEAGDYSVTDLTINGVSGNAPALMERGGELIVDVCVRARDRRTPVLAIGIKRADGTAIFGITTEMEQAAPCEVVDDIFRWRVTFDAPPLLPGSYVLAAHAMDPEGVRLFDTIERVLTLRGSSRALGMIQLSHRWDA